MIVRIAEKVHRLKIRIPLAIVFIVGFGQSIASAGVVFILSNSGNGWRIVDSPAYAGARIPAPKPLSYEEKAIPNRLGNIVVYRTIYHRGCGYSEPGLLVICLRADGTMDEYDRREMLARVRRGGTVLIGSDRGGRSVYETIQKELTRSVQRGTRENPIEIVEFNGCTGACGLRVEVRGGI